MAATLNRYVWDLYLNTVNGEQALTYFQTLDDFADRANLLEPFMSVGVWTEAQIVEGAVWEDFPMDEGGLQFIAAVRDAALQFPVETPDQVQQLLTELMNSGTVKLSDSEDDVLTLDDAFSNLPLVSLGLHLAYPETFLPYGLTGYYYLVSRVSETFGIPLPPVPPKKDLLARWLYYGHWCAAFQEFRQLNEMTLPELLAFLYDFSVNYVYTTSQNELPEPRNAWLLIGGVENGDLEWIEEQQAVTEVNWQGSLDMRRGDVCLMYIRSPVSAVHSLWRVVEDAYVDPFFHYKQSVQIGSPLRLPSLTFGEIAADPYLGGNKYVKANLQGASGKALSHGEYERFLQMLSVKADLPAGIPHFAPQEAVDLSALGNERDVEVQLVEPLLRRAGLESGDWVRQLAVRMGRGERVYPDYAIGVSGTAPEQRVQALVEVKYRMAGERDWREAFLQAKSYGLRLGAQVIVTAAAEGIRIYRRSKDDFDFAQGDHQPWSALGEGETLRHLGRLLSGRA